MCARAHTCLCAHAYSWRDTNVPRRVLSQLFPESQALEDAAVPSPLTSDSHSPQVPSHHYLSGNPGTKLARPILKIPDEVTELRTEYVPFPLWGLTSLLRAPVGGRVLCVACGEVLFVLLARTRAPGKWGDQTYLCRVYTCIPTFICLVCLFILFKN